MSTCLTVREIIDLARSSGISLNQERLPSGDELDTLVCITKCHPEGLEDEKDDVEYFNYVIYFEDYFEEGVIPLAKPLKRDE